VRVRVPQCLQPNAAGDIEKRKEDKAVSR